jgi:hypothetical protein
MQLLRWAIYKNAVPMNFLRRIDSLPLSFEEKVDINCAAVLRLPN